MLEMRQQALEDPARSTKGSTKEGYLFLQEKSKLIHFTLLLCSKLKKKLDEV